MLDGIPSTFANRYDPGSHRCLISATPLRLGPGTVAGLRAAPLDNFFSLKMLHKTFSIEDATYNFFSLKMLHITFFNEHATYNWFHCSCYI